MAGDPHAVSTEGMSMLATATASVTRAELRRDATRWATAQRLGRGVVLLAGLEAAVVSGGWVFGSRALVTPLFGGAPMQFDAALALVVFAATFLGAVPQRPRVAMAGGTIVALVGLLSLIENLTGVSLGIDEVLGRNWLPISGVSPGRLAPPIAAGLVLLGAALALPARLRSPRDALVTVALLVGGLGLLGHLLGLSSRVAGGDNYPVPIEAPVLLLAAAFALATGAPGERTRFSAFVAAGPRAMLLRRVLALATLLPLVAGIVYRGVTHFSLLDSTTASWTTSFGAIGVSTLVLWRAAAAVERIAAERDRASTMYRDLFDSISDGVYETRFDGRIVTASDSFAHLMGYPDRDTLVSAVRDISSVWADLDERRALVAEIRAGAHRGVRDIHVRHPNSDVTVAEINYSAVLEDGVPVGIRGTVRDVSTERAAEQRAAEATARFGLAFHSGPLGLAIVELDAGGAARFVDVNESLLRLVGMGRADFLAREPVSFIHPDDRLTEAAQLDACLHGDGETVSYETRRRHADGTWIPVRISRGAATNEGRRYAIVTLEDLRPQLALRASLRETAERAQRSATIASAAGAFTRSAFAATADGHDVKDEGLGLIADLLGCELVLLYGDEAEGSRDGLRLIGEHGADRRLLATGDLSAPSLRVAAGGRRTTLVEFPETTMPPGLPPLAAAHQVRSAIAVVSSFGRESSLLLLACARETRRWSGEEIGLVESVADLIALARHATETQSVLARNAQLLNDLTENAPAAVYLLDRDGRYLVANREAAQLIGSTPREMVGRTRREIAGFPPEGHDFRVHDLEVIESGRAQRFEEQLTTRDGRARLFLTIRFPLVDERGHTYGVGGISTDVTELREAQLDAERAWTETLVRIARAVEYRDEETGGHIDRMGAYCELIARRLGFSEDDAARLRAAAALHDAGKLAIPDDILQKPGRLTPEEFAVMQTHTSVGYQLLHGTGNPTIELAATIAYTHHERLDGSGYPRGLRRAEIPIEGRIAAVADVFDAMSARRVYRAAMSVDEVFDHLVANKDILFDTEVVEALLSEREALTRQIDAASSA